MPTENPPIISAQKQNLSDLNPLRQKLKEELQRSILLDEEDRAYWLSNLPNLPLSTIENLLNALVPKNQTVDMYVNAALADKSPEDRVKELKLKVQQIKQQAYKIEEKSETPSKEQAEEELLSQLDNLP